MARAHESWKSSGEAAIECGTLKGTGKGPGSPQVELEAVSTATRPAGLQNGNVDDENSCTGLSHKARNMLVTPGAVRRSFSSSPKKIPRQVLREGSGAANGKKRKAKRRSSSVDLNPGAYPQPSSGASRTFNLRGGCRYSTLVILRARVTRSISQFDWDRLFLYDRGMPNFL